MTKPDTPSQRHASTRAHRLHLHGRRNGRPITPAYKKPAVLAWAVILTLGLLLALYLLRAAA